LDAPEFRALGSLLLERARPDVVVETPTFDVDPPACDPNGEIRLFHAHVKEAVESAVQRLLNDIAADVLGRELLLAPAEIDAIVDRALRLFESECPVRVRLNAEDAAAAKLALPIAVDRELRRGDAVIELECGSVDASLGVRLATVLRQLQR
jgi:flagellar biosynthesis/type III secretory pathway protein FliH